MQSCYSLLLQSLLFYSAHCYLVGVKYFTSRWRCSYQKILILSCRWGSTLSSTVNQWTQYWCRRWIASTGHCLLYCALLTGLCVFFGHCELTWVTQRFRCGNSSRLLDWDYYKVDVLVRRAMKWDSNRYSAQEEASQLFRCICTMADDWHWCWDDRDDPHGDELATSWCGAVQDIKNPVMISEDRDNWRRFMVSPYGPYLPRK